MGTFGFKANENILGSGKHELHRFVLYAKSEGDGVNIKARVKGTDTIPGTTYNFNTSTSEVTSIENGDDGTYFAYGYSGSILSVKTDALVATPTAIIAHSSHHNFDPSGDAVYAYPVVSGNNINIYFLKNDAAFDLRTLSLDEGFWIYTTYLSAA